MRREVAPFAEMKKGRPEPRRDAGRPRGEAIVDAVLSETLQDLVHHGVANLSIDRIARAADVNKTSVYRRWPTRAALVDAALTRVQNDLGAELRDTGSLRGDLLVLARSIAELLALPVGRELARAAFVESSALGPPALGAASEEARALVERARERGELDAGADAQMMLSVLAGAILHRVMLEREPTKGPWLEALVDLVARGVSAAPGRRRRS